MGQSPSQSPIPQSQHPQPTRPRNAPTCSFEQHEGILKLRKVPFRNSIQISQHPPLFLQNIPDTLLDILQPRYNTNKYFSEHQIQQFVESVLYTLSFLETKNVTYTDLSIENIHFDDEQGTYKLLPLELIKQGIYQQALKSKNFGLLSPELILGLRYKEKQMQQEIMNKSNVFTFGMILLEIATLQPSIECYDVKQNQILDDIITERLEKVQEIYHPRIEKLIEMMIEYDYTKRLNLKELSILVNKSLAQNSIGSSSNAKRNKSFSRFRNIDQSLSHQRSFQKQSYQKQYDRRYEKPQKDVIRESISRVHEKSTGSRTISPSRLKANTVLPVNYHQTPKRQSVQYPPVQVEVPQEPVPQFVVRQKSSKRVQYEQEEQELSDQYHEEDNYYPQEHQKQHPSYQNSYAGYSQQQTYSQPANYSRIVYCPPAPQPQTYQPPPQPQYSQQYPHQYQYPPQQYSQHYSQYPQPQQYFQPPIYNIPTPKNYTLKQSTTIYPPSQKSHPNPNTQTYYEPQNQYYDYHIPQRPSTSNYAYQHPSPSIPNALYQQSPQVPTPSKHNPYINYHQPPSKQLSFDQQYQDSFSKAPAYSSPHHPVRSHNYMPPHRDSGTSYNILKENNAQRYDRKSAELSDLSDSSIVKIKEEIAKSRELIMELQKHDSGHRR